MIYSLNRKHETRVTDASPQFLAALQERNWEGNVRELRNVVERSSGSGALRPSHYPHGRPPLPENERGNEAAIALPVDPDTVSLRVGTTLDEAERVLIERTLADSGMNKTPAASILGITTKTLTPSCANISRLRTRLPSRTTRRSEPLDRSNRRYGRFRTAESSNRQQPARFWMTAV
jgi:DNA-binding NtrC family response regulator